MLEDCCPHSSKRLCTGEGPEDVDDEDGSSSPLLFTKSFFRSSPRTPSRKLAASCTASPSGLAQLESDDSFFESFDLDYVVHESGRGDASIDCTGDSTVSTYQSGIVCNGIKRALKQNAFVAKPMVGENYRKSLEKEASAAVAKRVEAELERDRRLLRETDLTFYGLPAKTEGLLERFKGITDLYSWQKDCLSLPALKERKNLLYSLPTSGGKTLVAEILMLREIVTRQKNVIFILPFVALVQEKVRSLSPFGMEFDFLVEEYASSRGIFPPQKRRRKHSIYVCTIEKGHGLVNSLLELNRLSEIGMVVVDEIHILGESGGRGANLECMLAKLLFSQNEIEIIGMSATLGNLHELGLFLRAELYTQDFRPVDLKEYVKVDDDIWEVDRIAKSRREINCFVFSRKLKSKYSAKMKVIDPDGLGSLVLEVVPEHSCLVFCATKRNCENVAEIICKALPREVLQHKKSEKQSLYRALKHEGNNTVCPVLTKTLPFGVVYHHSGLTQDERKLLEEAYLTGTLCCICCTSTLAAGINLPARRVILRSPYIGRDFLSYNRYKQMIGRAGRAGMDTSGESILLCKMSERKQVASLIMSPVEKCLSSLHLEDGKGIQQLLLSVISLTMASNIDQICQVTQCTLLQVQSQRLGVNMEKLVQSGLDSLKDKRLVKQQKREECSSSSCSEVEVSSLAVTKLGKAAIKGCVDPDYSAQLFMDLRQAQDGLVLQTPLHLLYLLTPYEVVEQVVVSPSIFYDVFMKLKPAELQAAKIIGITEASVVQLAQGRSVKSVSSFVMQRFYISLMLLDLWNVFSVWDVAEKFQVPRGMVQSLVGSASSFGSSVFHFCQEFSEFWAFHDLLGKFTQRLSHCCRTELLPLMELPAVKMGRAKQLYNAGFKNLNDVANADPEALVKAVEHLSRKYARQMVSAARMKLVERAESLREEAEELESVLSKGNVIVPLDAPQWYRKL